MECSFERLSPMVFDIPIPTIKPQFQISLPGRTRNASCHFVHAWRGVTAYRTTYDLNVFIRCSLGYDFWSWSPSSGTRVQVGSLHTHARASAHVSFIYIIVRLSVCKCCAKGTCTKCAIVKTQFLSVLEQAETKYARVYTVKHVCTVKQNQTGHFRQNFSWLGNSIPILISTYYIFSDKSFRRGHRRRNSGVIIRSGEELSVESVQHQTKTLTNQVQEKHNFELLNWLDHVSGFGKVPSPGFLSETKIINFSNRVTIGFCSK